MKVLNCPHCGNPPIMQTFQARMKTTYSISCPFYACNMPYFVAAPAKARTIMEWNRVVKAELERIKK